MRVTGSLFNFLSSRLHPFFDLLFGICCSDRNQKQSFSLHIPVLETVLKVTAGAIRGTQDAWLEALLKEHGIDPNQPS